MVVVEGREAPARVAEQDAGERQHVPSRPVSRRPHDQTETDLIRDTLLTCARTFGTDRARFIRQTTPGEWQVYSLLHGHVMTHHADYAEVAMAWTIGLSRFPTRATRPRITYHDGSGVRPIAVSTYFGIPVLCGDHLVGVIELAGKIEADLIRTLDSLTDTLARFGSRLTHDPSLHAAEEIDMESICLVDGGSWSNGEIDLTADDWAILAELGRPEPLSAIAGRLPFEEQQLLELIRSMAERGIVAIR